jgi:heat shock protein 4
MSSVVGLDLGLQNCVIAAAGRGGVDVILNGNSNRLNP